MKGSSVFKDQTVRNNLFEYQERREALLPWGGASREPEATGTYHVHHTWVCENLRGQG